MTDATPDNQRMRSYARWLLDNSDKQGTREFELVAERYRELRSSASQTTVSHIQKGVAARKNMDTGVTCVSDGLLRLAMAIRWTGYVVGALLLGVSLFVADVARGSQYVLFAGREFPSSFVMGTGLVMTALIVGAGLGLARIIAGFAKPRNQD